MSAYRWFLWVCVGLLTAGCGGGLEETGPDSVPTFQSPPTAGQIEFVRQFPFINRAREMKPPQAPDGTTPFGALLVVRQPGEKGNFCSATHLAEGYVVTNAHCVPDYTTLGPGRFFLVYYNKDGEKTFTQTESFYYVGDATRDDVAVLKISAEAAQDWDVAGAQILKTQKWAGTKAYEDVTLPDGTKEQQLKTFPVTVWSLDPFGHHEDLIKKWRGPGMWFNPKECIASRRLPKVDGVKAPPVGIPQRIPLLSNRAKESLHVFVDQCSDDLKHGNSGSLISLRNDFEQKLGLYHWGIQPLPGEKGKYNWYEVTGNQDKVVYHDGESDFFGVGTSLENLARPFPGLTAFSHTAYFTQYHRYDR